jgi:hypothetical protein
VHATAAAIMIADTAITVTGFHERIFNPPVLLKRGVPCP